jgi:hypothetical protein
MPFLYTSCVLDCALRFFNNISLTCQKKKHGTWEWSTNQGIAFLSLYSYYLLRWCELIVCQVEEDDHFVRVMCFNKIF